MSRVVWFGVIVLFVVVPYVVPAKYVPKWKKQVGELHVFGGIGQ